MDRKAEKGQLNRDGRAHVPLSEATETQVSFAELDAEAWEKVE